MATNWMNETAKASKWRQEDLNPGSPDGKFDVLSHRATDD